MLAVLLPMVMQAQSLPLRKGGDSLPFKGGEKFTYKLHYKLGPINSDVAHATISVDSVTYNGRKALSARIFGQTAKFYDTFFKVREDFRSTFDYNLLPLHFYRDTREGSWYCKNDAQYVWNGASSYARLTVENSAEELNTKDIPLQQGTCDITSMVYMMRNADMEKISEGQSFTGTMMLDGATFTMRMTYKGTAPLKDKTLGTVNVIRWSVRLNAGETFDTKEDLIFMFTADANRIPVRFEAPFKFGGVSGRLVAYEGIKYPVAYGLK